MGEKHAAEINLDTGERRLRLALQLARDLIGTPHHLSRHPGGFVLTRDRLDELVPIEPAAMADRQVIEWNKDDIDALPFMKVNCLALGMLSAMKRGFDLLGEPNIKPSGQPPLAEACLLKRAIGFGRWTSASLRSPDLQTMISRGEVLRLWRRNRRQRCTCRDGGSGCRGMFA